MTVSSQSPILSVIIVSWNAREMLASCLRSLRIATAHFSREILVVDNASHDGLQAMVRREFPEVRLIANAENRGFSIANNQGMEKTSGRYILLLNPDTLITDPEALDQLVSYMEAHPKTAAAGPRLDFSDGRHQVGDAGYAPTWTTITAYALFLSRLFPGRCRGLYISAPQVVDRDIPTPVDWICGAAFLIRRNVIEQVGGLDEKIFMYAEDVEWGCRMRSAGLTLMYLPGIHILHYGGGSENLASDKPFSTRWLESLACLYKRQNSGNFWLGFRLPMTVGFVLRGLAYWILANFKGDEKKAGRSRAMFAYARCCWRLVFRNLT
jgi:N-acetylglucosaminyl-diphospho-decaprenol L-rhamnosyltransferase